MIALVAVVFFAAAAVASPVKPLEGVDPNRASCDPEQQVVLLLPSFDSCNKFFMCNHGKEVEFTCPPPLIFDWELQTCNWADSTICTLRDSDPVEGSGEYDEGTDEFAGSVDVVSDDAETSVVAQSFKVNLNCKDGEQSTKRMAHKYDCQRYWRCSEGKVNSFYCTDGLFFNEKSQQCDFEANVVCNVNHEHELQGEFMVYKS